MFCRSCVFTPFLGPLWIRLFSYCCTMRNPETADFQSIVNGCSCVPTKVAGKGRLRLCTQKLPGLATRLSPPRYASMLIFMFLGKTNLAASTDGNPCGAMARLLQPKVSESLAPRRDCSATAPTAAKAASQSVVGSTASMASTTTCSHCMVLTAPPGEIDFCRRHASWKAPLKRANKCASHGWSSAVIEAGM